mmetsp:Transcript_23944/g.39604  ORF Transcript_23944/g.39604 Transcript_23944/m.39604 type:complete len:527 (+) Transcript_23944:98-1678(+)|eukprot:CAMPEP_0119003184 /NCGR_PEP_ID=MMETSP1176-20130426/405_1 /TAXON_ID=265551 /ORGANISM="Synedropsis recta cf, Strain CCMP1620" /LENGTH=526 /DNA_ID=CAMNT_0006954757 /DNA_START=70 /DNA_END=1650 /DNA_ORIENTATION=-
MATALISGDCKHVADANEMFAEEKGLLILRPGHGACKFWFSVPSGCYALVTRHGADLDYESKDGKKSVVWPAGLHACYPPWVKVSHLVNMESIILELPVKACKTKDNVTVNIDVGLAFRIMGDEKLGEDPGLVRKFVHQVKPRGLEQQLRDAQEEAVRALARSLKHTEVYGIRSGGNPDRDDAAARSDDASAAESDTEESTRDDTFVGSNDQSDRLAAKKNRKKGENVAAQMRTRLNNQFIPQGVQVLSVMIKSISLPDDITGQMTDKTMVISKQAAQRMRHQNAMQSNRMEQDVATMLQGFHETREQELTSGAETWNSEQVKLNDAKAQAEKMEANIREESNVKIDNLLAENALEVQRVKDRMYETVSKFTAEAGREAAELLANTRVETETTVAAARLQKAKNEAKAAQIIAKAEGKIAPWIEKKKEHETMVKQMDVYKRLANNDNLVISGSSDADTNLVAVADAILQNMDSQDGTSRSAIMAEMAILSRGAGYVSPPVPREAANGQRQPMDDCYRQSSMGINSH